LATRIVIVSDTHCREWDEVHPDIRREVAEADIAIHCGDFTGQNVVQGMRDNAKRAVVVHGNSDPPDLRSSTPYVEVLEVEGHRIGVTHPAWGGPEFPLEELFPDFPEPVDVVRSLPRDDQRETRRSPVRQSGPGLQIVHGFSDDSRPHRGRRKT